MFIRKKIEIISNMSHPACAQPLQCFVSLRIKPNGILSFPTPLISSPAQASWCMCSLSRGPVPLPASHNHVACSLASLTSPLERHRGLACAFPLDEHCRLPALVLCCCLLRVRAHWHSPLNIHPLEHCDFSLLFIDILSF